VDALDLLSGQRLERRKGTGDRLPWKLREPSGPGTVIGAAPAAGSAFVRLAQSGWYKVALR